MIMAPRIENLTVSAYTIPTETPESDGTLEWSETTLVLVEVAGAGKQGIGFTYADSSTAHLIRHKLTELVQGKGIMDVPRVWLSMVRAIRNLGQPGIAAMAISAVDAALWDLKARLLELPLCTLLGMVRDWIPVYGSGGFTSYSIDQLQKQLGDWAQGGIRRVKMKVGREPNSDPRRVAAAREAIGDETELFVDANGAYDRKQALTIVNEFCKSGVTWFEEPVPSDDVEGLAWIRNQSPPGLEIAAGEYGYESTYFRRMLEAGAIDVLQADATRCGGITGFLQVSVLANACSIPISCHCAPSLHVHPACAVNKFRHAEYFYDHTRIEQRLFEGAPVAVQGRLRPDLSQPGLGIAFRRQDAEKYRIKHL
jgi:L-alanine-DL-glutamate epimerase-like enolase superfamily enzyme